MAPPALSKEPNYEESIDFNNLVKIDPEFKKLLVLNDGTMNWKNPKHVMQLTKCLLMRDFGLKLELPNNRLCPPVPGRYAYISWIQALLDTSHESFSDKFNPERQVLGIDVGIGSSCIYPLLGTVARPSWRFYGTDIDQTNLDYAQKNISLNELGPRIRLLKTNELDRLFPLAKLNVQQADFTMCNPPFFASRSEMLATHEKGTPPSAVCTGAEVEMITEGGDAAYVCRMVVESKELGTKVQWYTSMLGKLSSVSEVVAQLKKLECQNWAVNTLRTHGKTKRWVVGWSWGDLRPRNDVARCDLPTRNVLPFPTEFSISAPNLSNIELADLLNKLIGELDVRWMWKQELWAGMVGAKKNTWSRAARRERARKASKKPRGDEMEIDEAHDETEDDTSMTEDVEPALIVKIKVDQHHVSLRWLKGFDVVLFESFCTLIKREIDTK
ncbi:hypothetical protein BT63DRAFT_460377 [Microthyrium microscopicum]|uniref:U6 small nuclear RNA (adenine-(43)-N(6))-methyltransferase n=1 Tax=Microthyrium microscopicum TaxID=703497 RepID=A0A6A6TX94_9PEZI|nr:hypothetical protein BT63DRAFT_460377 [Microthyrium microscopicum]